ncbi:MAG: ABC transporter ATP-binding protein, partial [Halofilum sp. (in: g-proteobacteria)]
LVGPNGAGKTTLLRCLAALDTPFAGRVSIAGHDTVVQPRQCHRRIGYLSDTFGLYDTLTVRQSLSYMALAHHLPPGRISERVIEVSVALGLEDRLEQRTGELSRGLRQRVAIGKAIIHQPQVLLLDEPASGLDPEARNALAELFRQLRDLGMTIVVSSHILAELEAYSTHMLVLREGHIQAHRALDAPSPNGPATALRVRAAGDLTALLAWLNGHPAVTDTHVRGDEITFGLAADTDAQEDLLRDLVGAGFPVLEFAEQRLNLQERYLADAGAEQAWSA